MVQLGKAAAYGLEDIDGAIAVLNIGGVTRVRMRKPQ